MELLIAWMNSDVFYQIIDGNEVYCSQAKTYVARCFIEEMQTCRKADSIEIDDDILYWFGYLVTYWCFSQSIKPGDISRKYDIKSIVRVYHGSSMEVKKPSLQYGRLDLCRFLIEKRKIIIDRILYSI